MTKDATQVTQADWGAAESYWDSLSDDWNPWRGISEEERLLTVQAFARHREAATAPLTAQVEALTAERDALREALAEQVGECFDERCEMCLRHESLLASTSEGEGA